MSPNHDLLQPRLPVELQKEIFELTASSHIPGIPSLLLVAQRVKTWIEPILYRTFIVGTPVKEWTTRRISSKKFLELLHSRPASFFHDHVRHLLCADVTIRELEVILTKCSGIQDFFFLHNDLKSKFLPLLAEMTLCRLDISLTSLFHPASIDFAHPLFQKLTHLSIESDDIRVADWTALASLPCLTHLAISEMESCAVFKTVLTHCSYLSVSVLVWFVDRDVNTQISAAFAHDKRFVQLVVTDYVEDWETGVTGGADFWSRAEAIIQQRESSIQNSN